MCVCACEKKTKKKRFFIFGKEKEKKENEVAKDVVTESDINRVLKFKPNVENAMTTMGKREMNAPLALDVNKHSL